MKLSVEMCRQMRLDGVPGALRATRSDKLFCHDYVALFAQGPEISKLVCARER